MNAPTYADAQYALARAITGFEERLRAVRSQDWQRPTPCEGWTVSDLVKHLVGGGIMSELLLNGASREDAMTALFNLDLKGDLLDAFADARDRQAACFSAPGAEQTICHHPMRDMPASEFIWLRIRDTTIHTWDLAHAIGADEALDKELVALIWSEVEPVAPMLAASGMFGSGASGEVSEQESLQTRLLDACGRRP